MNLAQHKEKRERLMKKPKDRYSYIALFEYAEDGINIEFPDLPGCYPCADPHDTDMAIKTAIEAIKSMI